MFLLEMSFGASGQKFPIGGMGFENQQGIGGPSAEGMMNNEMVMYPTYGKINSYC